MKYIVFFGATLVIFTFQNCGQSLLTQEVEDTTFASALRSDERIDESYRQLGATLASAAVSSCPAAEALRGTGKDASASLTACINASRGQTLRLEPGVYSLGRRLVVTGPITIASKNKTLSSAACGPSNDTSCVTFKAMNNVPSDSERRGLLDLVGDRVQLSHIVVDGDRQNRMNSPNRALCVSDNGQGINVTAKGTNPLIVKSVLKNSLCGTGLEVWASSTGLVFTENSVVANGSHYENMLWADGVTIHDSKNVSVSNNVFVDNTDVQLILGGCSSCSIQNNRFSHTSETTGASYAELMIHAWPGGSGNYTGTLFSGNDIDCGSSRLCGYGILVGADSWYANTPTFGANVTGNTIKRAMVGISVDEVSGAVLVMNNYISDILDGEFACQQNPSQRSRAAVINVSRKSFGKLTAASQADFTNLQNAWSAGAVVQNDYDGCIPQPPYLNTATFSLRAPASNPTATPTPTPTPPTTAPVITSEQRGFVLALYSGFLKRAPDSAGYDFQLARLSSVGARSLIREVSGSPEGLSVSNGLTSMNYVTSCYTAVLGRSPSSAEVSYWVGLLDGRSKTRPQMVEDFLYSVEFTSRMAQLKIAP